MMLSRLQRNENTKFKYFEIAVLNGNRNNQSSNIYTHIYLKTPCWIIDYKHYRRNASVNCEKTMSVTLALTLKNFTEKWQIPVLLKVEQGNFSWNCLLIFTPNWECELQLRVSVTEFNPSLEVVFWGVFFFNFTSSRGSINPSPNGTDFNWLWDAYKTSSGITLSLPLFTLWWKKINS